MKLFRILSLVVPFSKLLSLTGLPFRYIPAPSPVADQSDTNTRNFLMPVWHVDMQEKMIKVVIDSCRGVLDERGNRFC